LNKNSQTVEPLAVYHTYNNEIHKGYTASCKECKKKGVVKTPKEEAKELGRAGGKKSGKLRDKHCKCGNKIRKTSKTGKCLECYHNWIREQHAQLPKTAIKQLTCKEKSCNTVLDRRNRSGYCRKHYNKATNFQNQIKQHSAWSTTAIFGKDVKTAKDS